MTQCERHIEFVVKVKQMRTAQKQYFHFQKSNVACRSQASGN